MILNSFQIANDTFLFSLGAPTLFQIYLKFISVSRRVVCWTAMGTCWGCWPNLQSALNYFCLLLLVECRANWKDEKHVAYKCRYVSACVCVYLCYSFVWSFINKQIKMQQAVGISWAYVHTMHMYRLCTLQHRYTQAHTLNRI